MKPIPALDPNAGFPVRERGVISILMAFLLVAGVIFILAQTMGIIGTRSTDTSQQLDSTAALMLAESGQELAFEPSALERARTLAARRGAWDRAPDWVVAWVSFGDSWREGAEPLASVGGRPSPPRENGAPAAGRRMHIRRGCRARA